VNIVRLSLAISRSLKYFGVTVYSTIVSVINAYRFKKEILIFFITDAENVFQSNPNSDFIEIAAIEKTP
jgi:hypothetical protein